MAAYDISTVGLSGDEYHVTQSLIRNRYTVTGADGEVVLRGKQKRFKLKEAFPFVDGNGNDAFTVKADGILDVAGSYTLTDDGSDEPVVVLDKNFSLFVENWTIRDPDTGAELATIRTKNKAIALLRHVVYVATFVPHRYEIVAPDGDHVGDIEGKFSIRDTYTVSIDDASDVPKEAVLAVAVVLDALENK